MLKSQAGGETKRVELWGTLRDERGISLHWNRTVNEPGVAPPPLTPPKWHRGSQAQRASRHGMSRLGKTPGRRDGNDWGPMTTGGKEEGGKRMVDESLLAGKRKNISFQEFSSYSYPEEACANVHSVRKSPNGSFSLYTRPLFTLQRKLASTNATSYTHRNSTEETAHLDTHLGPFQGLRT